MTQTRLFANEYPARPERHSDAISKRAAEILLPAFLEWLGDEAGDDALADLVEASRFSDEGYEMAKRLERKGYTPDAELVEVLDGLGHCKYEAHDEAQKDWVKAHDLTLDLGLGASVSLTVRGTQHTGEISGLHPATAEYTVMIPALGHVRQGLGPHGVIVGFERVTAITQESPHAPRTS